MTPALFPGDGKAADYGGYGWYGSEVGWGVGGGGVSMWLGFGCLVEGLFL